MGNVLKKEAESFLSFRENREREGQREEKRGRRDPIRARERYIFPNNRLQQKLK